MKLELPKEYPYAYETHLHTNAGSACGRSTPEAMALACKDAGYTGIMVTDHFFYGNTAIDRKLSWEQWATEYCTAYERAKNMGDSIGLQVFFGWEATYSGTDFLVYGLDKEWLLQHPEIRDASVAEQYELVKRDGGFIIHAHPFREEPYIPQIQLFPEYVDGVEIINRSHLISHPEQEKNPRFDKSAYEYACKYKLPMTAGSDIHSIRLTLGGMSFPRRLESLADYREMVRRGEGIFLPQISPYTEMIK